MAATTANSGTAPSIGPAEQRELDAASARAKKIRRAAAVAGFNGWTTAVLAVCSAPFALFGIDGLLIAIGLGVIACNEFRGRRRLRRFDPAGATLLGLNQLGFLAMILGYCGWRIAVGLLTQSPFSAELANNPQLQEVLGSTSGLDATYRVVLTAFYGVVALLSAAHLGIMAIYYFTRRRHVEAYLRDTPPWVVDLQRRIDA